MCKRFVPVPLLGKCEVITVLHLNLKRYTETENKAKLSLYSSKLAHIYYDHLLTSFLVISLNSFQE